MRFRLDWLGSVLSFAAVSTIGTARAAECVTDFDTQASLAELEAIQEGGSIIPAYYDEHCTSSVRMHFEDTLYKHFHLTYFDDCMGLQFPLQCPSNTQYNTNCGSSPPVCVEVDVTLQPRYVTSHWSDANLTMTVLPSPGQYCIDNGGGGQVCKTLAGRWVAPRTVQPTHTVFAPDNANSRLWGRRWDKISVGTPGGVRYTLAGVSSLLKDNMVPGSSYSFTNSRIYDKLWGTLVNTSGGAKMLTTSLWRVDYQ